MKDVSDVLNQGMQIKLTHKVDTTLEPVVEGFFGLSLVNGAISGVFTKGEKNLLRYYPIGTFKLKIDKP